MKAEEFLAKVRQVYGAPFAEKCKEVLALLPKDEPFDPFKVVMRARLREQEPERQVLAAMSATAFASARDPEE